MPLATKLWVPAISKSHTCSAGRRSIFSMRSQTALLFLPCTAISCPSRMPDTFVHRPSPGFIDKSSACAYPLFTLAAYPSNAYVAAGAEILVVSAPCVSCPSTDNSARKRPIEVAVACEYHGSVILFFHPHHLECHP